MKTIVPVHRKKSLPADLSSSVIVNSLGGRIAIPGAGFSLVIPPLAVAPGTKITVTALAGSNLAYEFEPHGLQFTVPLVASQDLRQLVIPRNGLPSIGVGYFPDPAQQTEVSEMLDVTIQFFKNTATTNIWHFSGYIFAGGESNSAF